MDEVMFSSKEVKAILNVSDCELMHLRTSNQIAAIKKGNSFFYQLPKSKTALDHPLGKKLINWYTQSHAVELDNQPKHSESISALQSLVIEILLPVYRKYPKIEITYGFTSSNLKTYISKHSSNGTAPILDQHASCELNSAQNQICDRSGAACDFIVPGLPSSTLTCFIVENLNYDRVYYYGSDRPIHVSVSKFPIKHLQVMAESESGRRYPSSKAFGAAAIDLAKELL
jgi:hypothetical protein